MKLASLLITILVTTAPSATTSYTLPPPSGSHCWNTTVDIMDSEATLASTSSSRINEERVYILCSQTYVIGSIPSDDIIPVGGGFPMVVINPNMHILCEKPGTCIFQGGLYQLVNLDSNFLLEMYIASRGLPSLPDGYFVDTSNLVVEGLVFRGASDTSEIAPFYSNVFLMGPGVNMTIQDSLWTEQDTAHPPSAGVTLYRTPGVNISGNGGSTLYLSLALQNCTFRNNVFSHAAIQVDDDIRSNETESLQLPSLALPLMMGVTMDDCIIEDNVILGIGCNCSGTAEPPPADFAAVVHFNSAYASMTNCILKNNSMARAFATTVSIYSELDIAADSVTFMDNSIDNDLGSGCTDIANVTTRNGNWTVTCTELSDTPPPTTTPAPTSSSSAAPAAGLHAPHAVSTMVLGGAMTMILVAGFY